jgi:hypothetical protein
MDKENILGTMNILPVYICNGAKITVPSNPEEFDKKY